MSDQNLVIREVEQHDLDGLAALLDEISEMHVAAIPEYFQRGNPREQAERLLREAADSPKAVVLVAEAQGQVVGLVDFEEREAEDHPILTPRRYLKVGTLVVARSHRGRGIGKALMRRAHDWAEARGLSEAELNVYEFNQGAIGLYERLGYVTRTRRMVRKLARPGDTGQRNEANNE